MDPKDPKGKRTDIRIQTANRRLEVMKVTIGVMARRHLSNLMQGILCRDLLFGLSGANLLPLRIHIISSVKTIK